MSSGSTKNIYGKPSDGLVSRYLNRPVSIRLSRILAHWPWIEPGHLTFSVFLVSLAMGGFLIQGTWVGFVVGTLFYHLASVLDGCDGELARMKGMTSRRGEILDTATDQFSNHWFVLAVGIGLSRQAGISSAAGAAGFQGNLYLGEAVATALVMALTVLGIARRTYRQTGRRNFNEFGSSLSANRPFRFLTGLLRRDSYALLFVFFPWLGLTDWILHLMAVGVLAHAVVFLAARKKRQSRTENDSKAYSTTVA